MKLYHIHLMGGEKVLVGEEDVAKIIKNSGAKLVLVRGSLVNPSSISVIKRAWNADSSELEQVDTFQLGTNKQIE